MAWLKETMQYVATWREYLASWHGLQSLYFQPDFHKMHSLWSQMYLVDLLLTILNRHICSVTANFWWLGTWVGRANVHSVPIEGEGNITPRNSEGLPWVMELYSRGSRRWRWVCEREEWMKGWWILLSHFLIQQGMNGQGGSGTELSVYIMISLVIWKFCTTLDTFSQYVNNMWCEVLEAPRNFHLVCNRNGGWRLPQTTYHRYIHSRENPLCTSNFCFPNMVLASYLGQRSVQ